MPVKLNLAAVKVHLAHCAYVPRIGRLLGLSFTASGVPAVVVVVSLPGTVPDHIQRQAHRHLSPGDARQRLGSCRLDRATNRHLPRVGPPAHAPADGTRAGRVPESVRQRMRRLMEQGLVECRKMSDNSVLFRWREKAADKTIATKTDTPQPRPD